MNEDNNNENNDVENESNNNIQKPAGLRSNISSFFKRPLDKLGKGVGSGIKNLLQKIPVTLRIRIYAVIVIVIIVLIIFFAGALYILNKLSSNAVDSGVSNYMSNISNQALKDDYQKKGTLLNLPISDVDKIYDQYVKDNSDNHDLLDDMQKKFNSGNTSVNFQQGALSFNDDRELFKHILYTEKYNFNAVSWDQYKHSESNVTKPEMSVDSNTGLQYPKDSSITEQQFVSMLSPYLQNWYIPLVMYSASVSAGNSKDSGRNPEFAYQIITQAFSDITMNKYDLETLKKSYTQRIYHVNHMKKTQTKSYEFIASDGTTITSDNEKKVTSYNQDTKTITYSDGSQELDVSMKELEAQDPTETEVSQDKEITDPEKEVPNSRNTTTQTVYNLLSAYTFDVIIKNEFSYIKYNENNSPDTSKVVNVDQYSEKNNDETNQQVESKTDIYFNGNIPQISITYTSNYTENEGHIDHIDKTWSDKVSQINSSKESYTTDDFVAYNQDIQSNYNDLDYYKSLQSNNQLDRIMLINSKSSVFNQYLDNGTEYSSNIGFSRSYLNMAYDLLAQQLSSIGSDPNNLPFIYGQTLGINENYSGTMIQGSIDVSALPPGGFVWPVVTDGNEDAKDVNCLMGYTPAYGTDHKNGIDISRGSISTKLPNGLSAGPDIVASISGTVTIRNSGVMRDGFVGNDSDGGGYGNYIEIKDDSGQYMTRYGHLSEIYVSNGQKVTAGQLIAKMGTTGNSSGVHLHFEIWRNGQATDPMEYFNFNPTYGSVDRNSITTIPTPYKYVSSKAGYISGTSLTGAVGGTKNLSSKVQALIPTLSQVAAQYGMSDYVNLLAALMMQESGGDGLDVMQAAEGPFNTRYPKVPNGIQDINYSIDCGVQEFKASLAAANGDVEMALQAYNFGTGFISYARSRGGYSLETAQAFSDYMKSKNGSSVYGDPLYVPHVLRYYTQ